MNLIWKKIGDPMTRAHLQVRHPPPAPAARVAPGTTLRSILVLQEVGVDDLSCAGYGRPWWDMLHWKPLETTGEWCSIFLMCWEHSLSYQSFLAAFRLPHSQYWCIHRLAKWLLHGYPWDSDIPPQLILTWLGCCMCIPSSKQLEQVQ